MVHIHIKYQIENGSCVFFSIMELHTMDEPEHVESLKDSRSDMQVFKTTDPVRQVWWHMLSSMW